MVSATSSRSRSPAEAARRLLARWQDDPALFFEEVLGVTPWGRQREVLDAVAKHDSVAVRSGHKVGKSTSAAGLALWFGMTRPRARVVLTSSSNRQVDEVLWRELRRLHVGAKYKLGGKLSTKPAGGLEWADGRRVFGMSTDEPERWGGFSGPNQLFILDEGSGIGEAIFEAVDGNRAGGAKAVMLGNPTRTSGTFFDAFHSKRQFWRTIHVSSLESPNVREERIVIPGLATKAWADEALAKWGPNDPRYDVRVRGDFPRQSSRAVVSLHLVERAREAYSRTPGIGRLHIGVDVARYGDDDSVITPRRGRRIYPATIVHGFDGNEVAGKVSEVARAMRDEDDDQKPMVKVDVIGYGSSVYDALKHTPWLDVRAINVAETPDGRPLSGKAPSTRRRPDDRGTEEQYATLRDQLWFGVRDYLEDGGAIPLDEVLETELLAPEYTYTSRGLIKVASKESIKDVIGHSPDRADALALAIYEAPQQRGLYIGVSRRDMRR